MAIAAALAVPTAASAAPDVAASSVDTVLADVGADGAANGGSVAAALDSPTMDQYNSTNTDLPSTTVTGGGGGPAASTAEPAASGGGGGAPEALDSSPVRTVAAGGGLPFTGLPLAVVFGIGMTLTAVGLLLVLRGRKQGE